MHLSVGNVKLVVHSLRIKGQPDEESDYIAYAHQIHGDHPAMAQDRAGAVSAAMEKQQDAGRVGAGSERELAWDAIEIDRLEPDIIGDQPDGPHLVETAAALCPSDWPGL